VKPINLSYSPEYLPSIIENYRALADILARRNIKLVSVQYPVRSALPLKEMLKDKPVWAFVDNEKIFQDAVKRGASEEYFIDRFGRNFGHCTAKGNQLLAENAARVILEKLKD
jgi:hypothetical protein